MKIKVEKGGSQRDKEALHFSYSTMFGLGHEHTTAIYFPSTNVLEVCSGDARKLDKILKAFGKYINKFSYGSLDFGREPVEVRYWSEGRK